MTNFLPASLLEFKEISHKGFPVLNSLSCRYNVKQLADNEQSRKGKEKIRVWIIQGLHNSQTIKNWLLWPER